MAKVIILNAPAGSGKDTIANYLLDSDLAESSASFKTPIFNMAQAILGVDKYEQFISLYECRQTKEQAVGILHGLSPREFFIDISERMIKPVFGNDYFGKYMADSLPAGDEVVVVADGGFDSEILPLIDAGHEVHICRLYRDGFTFDGDSRNYIRGNSWWKKQPAYHDIYIADGEVEESANKVADACMVDHVSSIQFGAEQPPVLVGCAVGRMNIAGLRGYEKESVQRASLQGGAATFGAWKGECDV